MENRREEWFDLALKSRDPEKKLEYCNKHLELHPDDEDAWAYKATILDKYLGRPSEALRCVGRETELIDDPIWARALFELAMSDNETANQKLDEVLARNPNHAKAMLMKGRTLKRLGRPEEALVCIDRARQLGLNRMYQSIAWRDKAETLSDLNRIQEAISCCDNALEIDPGDAISWTFKGILLNLIERYEEALPCFNEALEILKLNPSCVMFGLAKDGKETACARLPARR